MKHQAYKDSKEFNEEIDRLTALKQSIEDGTTNLESLSPEDLILLDFIYQLEVLIIQDELSHQEEVLDIYKEELREAISYLKNRKV